MCFPNREGEISPSPYFILYGGKIMAFKKKDENVGIPTVEVTPNSIKIDTDNINVNEANIPQEKENVKIRMRVDHRCSIGTVRYDLKAGKTYNVPENVKRILNDAGLLSPL